MDQYSFDMLGQIMPCPDREKCGAYLLSPLPDGTPRGCTGERKWCKTIFHENKRNDIQKVELSSKQTNSIVNILKVILDVR